MTPRDTINVISYESKKGYVMPDMGFYQKCPRIVKIYQKYPSPPKNLRDLGQLGQGHFWQYGIFDKIP